MSVEPYVMAPGTMSTSCTACTVNDWGLTDVMQRGYCRYLCKTCGCCGSLFSSVATNYIWHVRPSL